VETAVRRVAQVFLLLVRTGLEIAAYELDLPALAILVKDLHDLLQAEQLIDRDRLVVLGLVQRDEAREGHFLQLAGLQEGDNLGLGRVVGGGERDVEALVADLLVVQAGDGEASVLLARQLDNAQQ